MKSVQLQWISILIFIFAIQGCGSKNNMPVPSPNSKAGAESGAAAESVKKENPLDFLKNQQFQEFYNPSGKRDPFKTFEGGEVVYTSSVTKAPLERFEMNQLDLTAIVWGIARPKVLFQAPDGYSYIAQVGTGIGRNRGKITKITKNRVLVNEEFRDPTGQYVVRESEFVMESEPTDEGKVFHEMELKYSDE